MFSCLHIDGIDIAGMNIYVGNCTVKNFDDVVAGRIRTCRSVAFVNTLSQGPLTSAAPRVPSFSPFHDMYTSGTLQPNPRAKATYTAPVQKTCSSR